MRSFLAQEALLNVSSDRVAWPFEPIKQALWASRDAIMASQIWSSKWERMMDDGCPYFCNENGRTKFVLENSLQYHLGKSDSFCPSLSDPHANGGYSQRDTLLLPKSFSIRKAVH